MTHRLLPLNDGFRSSIHWFAREFTATLARLPIQTYWLQFKTTRFHDTFAFNEQSQRNDNRTWRTPLYGIKVGLHTNPLQWWSFAPKDRCHVTTFSHVDVFNSIVCQLCVFNQSACRRRLDFWFPVWWLFLFRVNGPLFCWWWLHLRELLYGCP